jgi:excisionase family DNA binding protein
MNGAMSMPSNTGLPMLDAALALRGHNLSVMPILSRGKRPAIEWAQYQEHAATPSEIVGWFEDAPHNNLGIVTGAVSGIFVVDIDSDAALQRFQAQVTLRGGSIGAMQIKPHQQRAFTIREFTEFYRVFRTRTYEEIKARRLRAIHVGRRRLITADDAEEWLAALRQQAQAAAAGTHDGAG